MPKPKPKPKAKTTEGLSPAAKDKGKDRLFVGRYKELGNSTGGAAATERPTARRRLGHPNASAYNFEPTRAAAPRAAPVFQAPKRIRESAYPIYWVEVLDKGHQKWQPVDAVVTKTFWKPRVLEPPITDRENSMSYVVAFEADGSAKDVTRRYAKAYTAKTRRLRIETAVEGGEQWWWRKAMKPFRKPFPDDLEQIEDIELRAAETREPMPRNVQDFKDHPIYALERHLRRHEVLMPGAVPSGTVGAGSRAPLEKIYRRRDVRIARTADKWYRLGRVVKAMEIPVKWLPKKVRNNRDYPRFDDAEDQEDDDRLAGVPLYTTDQTDLYEPPRIRNGIVPKNKFGNIDVYVPSMVPRGGSHIVDEHAARAAFLLGIDYAPALTGFQFRGRHGTAVLSGVVVAREHEEAVRAVISGLADGERAAEEERRRAGVLRVWRRLLMGLRIRERIWRDVDEGERRAAEAEAEAEMQSGGGDLVRHAAPAGEDGGDGDEEEEEEEEEGDADREMEEAASDVTEEFDMVADEYYDDGGGGGFVIE
jgi:xeroderma pigmentosum group C-complementing protein